MIFLRLLCLTQAVLGSRKDDSDGMTHNHISNDIVTGTLHGNNPEIPKRKEVAVQKLLEADIAIGHDFHLNCDQKDLQGMTHIIFETQKLLSSLAPSSNWLDSDVIPRS